MSLLLALVLIGCANAPHDPHDVTDTFALSGDYRVSLWAESPEFFNPTNIDIDARGRVWVAEAVNYRDFNNAGMEPPYHEAGDRIVILEDTDHDGRADVSSVFVQDSLLRAPLGLAVIGNRVYVSSSPNLLVYTDDDGDGRADRREVLLTGFGGYDHDHGLHALLAGPDGRYYFNTGNAGPHVVTDRSGWTLRSGSVYNGGSPYNTENTPGRVSDDGRVWVGGLALRMNPDGTGLRVLAHNFRNAYELTVDSYGDLWQNDNDDQVLTCRTTWVMEDGNAGYFSADGTRFWQADHRPGQDAFTAHWHQDDPGVQPAGDNYGAGSPTGIVVYEGDAFGPGFRGTLLSADAGRNVVYAYRTETDGAGFRLTRSEFIASIDEDTHNYIWDDPSHDADPRAWFRPSDVAVGPDGAIYVADWYDPVVGGHQSRDRTVTGRIYRITPSNGLPALPEPDLDTSAGRIEALRSPALHVRALGAERLATQGEAAVAPVRALLDDENPYVRARAVWLLARLGPAGEREVEAMLAADDPRLRVAAFRALRQAREEDGADLVTLVRAAADDAHPAVRREAAIALRDAPWDVKRDLFLRLAAGYDGLDRWMVEALGTAALGDEGRAYDALTQVYGENSEGWDARMASLAWRLHPPEAVEALAARAAASSVSAEERRRAIDALAFIDAPAAAEAVAAIAHDDGGEVGRAADWWLRFRATNDWSAYPAALAVAAEAERASAPDPERLALRDRTADTTLTVDLRVQAATELAADPGGGTLLVGLLETQPLPYQITSVIRTALARNPDPAVRALAAAHFRGDGQEPLPDLSGLRADVESGAQVFTTRCATCHRVGDIGRVVGPDLSVAGQKFDRLGLLEAIVRPSASIAHGFEPWLITKRDGTTLLGFLLADGETVVVSDIAGLRHNLKADEVAARRTLDTSLMPDDEGLGLSDQDLADVVAFLAEQTGE